MAHVTHHPAHLLAVIKDKVTVVTEALIRRQEMVLVTSHIDIRRVLPDTVCLNHQTLTAAEYMVKPCDLLCKPILQRTDDTVKQRRILHLHHSLYCHILALIFSISSSFAPFSSQMMPHFSLHSPNTPKPYFAMMFAA